MPPEDRTDRGPQSPTALQDSTAPIVRKIRAAHTSGCDLKLDAQAAGEIADCIETLARLADQGRETILSLGAIMRPPSDNRPLDQIIESILAAARDKKPPG